MPIENTLFLGNGFSRSIFKEIPPWIRLFDTEDTKNTEDSEDSTIDNYTILYEKCFLSSNPNNVNKDEGKFKKGIMNKINTDLSEENIKENVQNLENFGKYLLEANINNIITTNYDNGIEFILENFCSYEKESIDITKNEHVYSIRTYKKYVNNKTRHEIKLWKIHGDMFREIANSTEYNPYKSITLGFDQYCGSLSKLNNYLKGEYESKKGVECFVNIKDKCEEPELFDNLSWAELFFHSNIYCRIWNEFF